MSFKFSKADSNQPAIVWTCAQCGVEKRPTAHQRRQKYCSRACVSEAYKVRMRGADNPNHKEAGKRICERCGVVFHSYSSSRKFCGAKCYHESRSFLSPKPCAHCGETFQPKTQRRKYCSPRCSSLSNVKPGSGYTPRPRTPNIVTCQHCRADFPACKSAKRKYCSVECFHESGGPQRAGDEAVKAMKKYGAKKDANHKEIFAEIKARTAVHDLSNAGFGVPDGLAWINDGWHLFDVKNPKTGYGKRGLNSRQKKWADDWRGGPVYLLYTAEDAEAFCNGDFACLKCFPDRDADTAAKDFWVLKVQGQIS